MQENSATVTHAMDRQSFGINTYHLVLRQVVITPTALSVYVVHTQELRKGCTAVVLQDQYRNLTLHQNLLSHYKLLKC